jgi:hypothetical protein
MPMKATDLGRAGYHSFTGSLRTLSLLSSIFAAEIHLFVVAIHLVGFLKVAPVNDSRTNRQHRTARVRRLSIRWARFGRADTNRCRCGN